LITLTAILHLLSNHSISTILFKLSQIQTLISTIKYQIYYKTAVEYIIAKYYLAADFARDRAIESSYISTDGILTDCFTMLQLRHSD
jgi:hypothetical protein